MESRFIIAQNVSQKIFILFGCEIKRVMAREREERDESRAMNLNLSN
jgi:hypothetical protein